MNRSILLFTAASMLFAFQADAQKGHSTQEGYALSWDKTIAVVPDSLQNGAFRLSAWTIALHEADASDVMGWWLADMQAVSTAVTKGKPAKAQGLRIPQLPEAQLAVAATAQEKKANLVKLTVAFAMNDSTPTRSSDGQEAYMRALAVKYNRAVVQAQIAVYEKQLAKAGDKLDDTKGDVAKSQSRITKSNSQLEKLKAKRAKIERDNAHLTGDIAGREKKFALSNDPKDLQKLTKAREKLAKGESSLAKLMQQEAKVQGDIAKEQGRLESTAGKAEDRGATKEEVQRVVDALKRKHDSIQ
jgi:peptidoglycan hydrolase CwlO-like protein